MDIKKAVTEVLIVFVVGALIGSVLAVVSNLFVEGVEFLSNIRSNFDLFEKRVGSPTDKIGILKFSQDLEQAICIMRSGPIPEGSPGE